MIPKKFKLGGEEFEILWDTKYLERRQALGEIDHDFNIIRLTRTLDDMDLPKDKVEHVYFHELVHGILNKMGEDVLCKDEAFVDQFASLLYQALKTSEF